MVGLPAVQAFIYVIEVHLYDGDRYGGIIWIISSVLGSILLKMFSSSIPHPPLYISIKLS